MESLNDYLARATLFITSLFSSPSSFQEKFHKITSNPALTAWMEQQPAYVDEDMPEDQKEIVHFVYPNLNLQFYDSAAMVLHQFSTMSTYDRVKYEEFMDNILKMYQASINPNA